MKQELYSRLMNSPAPQITEEIRTKLEQSPEVTPIAFSDKNRLLWDTSLQNEAGFSLLPSGGWLVAMRTEMQGITREMIDWWFWWHPPGKRTLSGLVSRGTFQYRLCGKKYKVFQGAVYRL